MFTDAEAFARGLRRLRAESGAMTLWNVDETFRVLLRSVVMDSDTEDEDEVEVSIVKNKHTERAIALDYDGYLDDDDEYILDELLVDDPKTMDHVNKVLGWRVCKCGDQFIKQLEFERCVACDMQPASEHISCCVCLDAVVSNATKSLACCSNKQSVCKSCLSKLERCPLCRTDFL